MGPFGDENVSKMNDEKSGANFEITGFIDWKFRGWTVFSAFTAVKR